MDDATTTKAELWFQLVMALSCYRYTNPLYLGLVLSMHDHAIESTQ